LFRHPRKFLAPALIFVALSAPWPLFAKAYFGNFLPQSALAKFQKETFLTYAWAIAVNTSRTLLFHHGWATELVVWAMGVGGAVILIRRCPDYALLVLYGAAQFAAYLYLRPFKNQTWHQYPGVTVLTLCAAVGLAASLSLLPATPRVWATRLVCVALLGGYLGRTVELARTYRSSYWYGNRTSAYRDVATYLRAHALPFDVLASVEPGTVAYYSGIRVSDLGGLVSSFDRRNPLEGAAWLMVDPLYLRLAEPLGRPPEQTFIRGDFAALLYRVVPQR
jgi:hypothetical protein